jgi:DNA-binding CsgD family transcriptional regulator
MSTDASRFSRAAYLDSSRLIDTFERDVDDVARTVAANVLTSMQAFPTYGQSDMERQVFEQVREHARLILNMTRTGCPPGPEQLEFARRAGALRTGVAPLAAVIHGYRVGCWSFCDWIGNAAGSDPEDLRAALSLTASCMEHDRIASGAIAAGYLRQRESQTGDPAEMLTNRASPTPALASRFARLSPRERELVDLVARGLTNREIGLRLRISLPTTKEYMSRVLEKMNLPSRAAVAAAYSTAQQRTLR